MRFIRIFTSIAIFVSMLASSSVHATSSIQVLALFKDKALVKIDGRKRMLEKGEESPEGVLLISSNSEVAVIEVEGQQGEYKVGAVTQLGNSFEKPDAAAEVRIYRDTSGMFRTVGSINGITASLLVDTGATTVAMNSGQAKRLGVNYRRGRPTGVGTASGNTMGYRVKLDNVRVGGIKLYGVEAIVIEGSHPAEILLGMSFLGRIQIENKSDHLILRKNY